MNQNSKIKIIEALVEYMLQHELSANEIAKRTGVNAAYISQLLNNKFTIKVGEKEVAIADKYFKIIAESIGFELDKNYWEIRPTPQLTRAIATLEDAKEFGYTNVLIGETGSGKSFSCKLFQQQNPTDTFIITVGHSDTIGDLIDKTIDALRIPSAKNKAQKIKVIIQKLRQLNYEGAKPMLIFDEAEYMKQPALCSMKEFYDNLIGFCAIILVGTDQLIQNLDRLRKKNRNGIPQLYRRIKFGIRNLPLIDRSFKEFLKGINDAKLKRFLIDNCDNYGELHDALVPAMREADRTGEELNENFVRTILGISNY